MSLSMNVKIFIKHYVIVLYIKSKNVYRKILRLLKTDGIRHFCQLRKHAEFDIISKITI